MGKRFAPALANIYLLEFDEKATTGYKTKPVLYFRYIDDIFFLWPGDVESLAEFETYLNNLIPSISIKLKYSDTEIDFLDVKIYEYKSENMLKTKVYFKDTDTHQLLHKDSFHPRHTFNGFIKSQLIRFKRISSDKTDYDNASKILFNSLKKRGYSHTMLRNAHKDIWFNYNANHKIEKQQTQQQQQPQQQQQQQQKQRDPRLIPIIVNFSTLGTKTGQKIKRLIQNNAEFKDDKTLVAYKQKTKILDKC